MQAFDEVVLERWFPKWGLGPHRGMVQNDWEF